MKAFAEAWPDEPILQQLVAKLPWGHNVRLIEQIKDPAERLWYAEQTLVNGWSRNVLVMQVEADLYPRQEKAGASIRFTRVESDRKSLVGQLRRFLDRDYYGTI